MTTDIDSFGFPASFSDEYVLQALQKQGYKTIFDIVNDTQQLFIKKLECLDTLRAKNIYQLAESRVHTVISLYKAIQMRSEPTLQKIPKMGVSPQPELLANTLSSMLGGTPNFGNLFPPRSEDGYAEPGSVQSLFSPTRYVTELYKVAKDIYVSDDPLNIDQRRPDIKKLILNSLAQDQKVQSIFILNRILTAAVAPSLLANDRTLESVYYPMTLPYDDYLTQIRCVFSGMKLSTQEVWATLIDYQWTMFNPLPASMVITAPDPFTREQLNLMPGAYALLISPPANDAQVRNHYNITSTEISTATVLSPLPSFTKRTELTFNQIIDMTSQQDYKTSVVAEQKASRFYEYTDLDSTSSVAVTNYGQTYLGSVNSSPMLVIPDPANSTLYQLNFTDSNVVTLADRAERLLRLQRQLKIDYPQLDWLIRNINQTLGRTTNYQLDTPVLNALAEFSRLSLSYALSTDIFACFIGTMNTYAGKFEKCMFETLFTSPTNEMVAPLTGAVNFDPTISSPEAALISSGLNISSNELFVMAQLAFGTNPIVMMSAARYAQLYRLTMIPRTLGISLPLARILWQLLDPDRDLAAVIAGPATLETLEIIRQTECVLVWMKTHKLDVGTTAAMVSPVYSSEPTPEIFNFLSNIYNSLSGNTVAVDYRGNEPLSESLSEMLCLSISGTFQLKSNIMSQLIIWQDSHFTRQALDGSTTQTPYKLSDFWQDIVRFFSSQQANSVEALTAEPNLVRYSNALAQYTLISHWADLTEQDLTLFVDTPSWFFDNAPQTPPAPSLPVLLLLSRLKSWQQRVLSTDSEAIGYFRKANQDNLTAEGALSLLAYIQGWELDLLQEMNVALVSEEIYEGFPITFQQLNRLDTWMQLSQQLNVGAQCIDQLYQMSLSNVSAESPALFKAVASSLASNFV